MKHWYAVCEIRDDDMPQDWETGAETLCEAVKIAEELIAEGGEYEIYRIECTENGNEYDATYRRDDDGDWVKVDPAEVWKF